MVSDIPRTRNPVDFKCVVKSGNYLPLQSADRDRSERCGTLIRSRRENGGSAGEILARKDTEVANAF